MRWSLTMYELPSDPLVANPLQRNLINSHASQPGPDYRRGYTFDPDASPGPPDKESNWLPPHPAPPPPPQLKHLKVRSAVCCLSWPEALTRQRVLKSPTAVKA